MSWTEQQIEMLKNMWGHGFSASDIAGKLGTGLTRNAVIGKAHRLKLSSRPSPIKAEGELNGRVAAAVASGLPVVKSTARKRVMLRPLPVLPQAPITTTVNRISNREPSYRPLDTAKSVNRGEGIAVTKAGERHCRWPVGDPRSPDFRFCGCAAYDSMPYCIDHARVAYQNIGKKHRAAEQPSENSGTPTVRHASDFRQPGQSRY